MSSAMALATVPVALSALPKGEGGMRNSRRRDGYVVLLGKSLQFANKRKPKSERRGHVRGFATTLSPNLYSMHFQLSNMLDGISKCHKPWCSFPRAINVMAGQSGGPEKLDIDDIVGQLRKLSDNFPQPVKHFPWSKAMIKFCQLIVELTWAVAKYLCVPLLAITSLSEMSYCAHERKMVLIPIPLLAGIAVAVVLKDTATELSPDLKEGGFPGHLLLIAIFFMLLKLPGPYYPYWGRLIIPHFANGGLWRTIWFALMWYRVPQETPGMASEESVVGNPSEEKK